MAVLPWVPFCALLGRRPLGGVLPCLLRPHLPQATGVAIVTVLIAHFGPKESPLTSCCYVAATDSAGLIVVRLEAVQSKDRQVINRGVQQVGCVHNVYALLGPKQHEYDELLLLGLRGLMAFCRVWQG